MTSEIVCSLFSALRAMIVSVEQESRIFNAQFLLIILLWNLVTTAIITLIARSDSLPTCRPQQSGFTCGKSTLNAILALHLLLEIHRAFWRSLYVGCRPKVSLRLLTKLLCRKLQAYVVGVHGKTSRGYARLLQDENDVQIAVAETVKQYSSPEKQQHSHQSPAKKQEPRLYRQSRGSSGLTVRHEDDQNKASIYSTGQRRHSQNSWTIHVKCLLAFGLGKCFIICSSFMIVTKINK